MLLACFSTRSAVGTLLILMSFFVVYELATSGDLSRGMIVVNTNRKAVSKLSVAKPGEVRQPIEIKHSKVTGKEITGDDSSDAEKPTSSYQPRLLKATEILQAEFDRDLTARRNFTCLQTSRIGIRFPICLYAPSEDVHVSASFYMGGYWEEQYVTRLIRSMLRISSSYNTSVGFLDVGANIGAYTLAIAHLGYSVLAVEPNKPTLIRLATAIYKGNLTEKVKLLRDPISDQREAFKLAVHLLNRGGTRLVRDSVADSIKHPANEASSHMVTDGFWSEAVTSILLDDLAYLVPRRVMVVKMDIECSEIEALNPKTSSKFFRVVNVPLIFMEWHCYFYRNKDESQKDLIEHLMSYLISMNYAAHDVASGKILSLAEWKDYTKQDIVFIKNDGVTTW